LHPWLFTMHPTRSRCRLCWRIWKRSSLCGRPCLRDRSGYLRPRS
jgi:hypothetical protein